MWEKIIRKFKKPARDSELYYAAHYHFLPLYIISGLLIVAVIVIGLYVRLLWVSDNQNQWHTVGASFIRSNDERFLSASANPADKKQYVYPASVRFTSADPYQIIRYTYNPGDTPDKAGVTLGLTTSALLRGV